VRLYEVIVKPLPVSNLGTKRLPSPLNLHILFRRSFVKLIPVRPAQEDVEVKKEIEETRFKDGYCLRADE